MARMMWSTMDTAHGGFQCARGGCNAEIGHPANQDAHNHEAHLEVAHRRTWGVPGSGMWYSSAQGEPGAPSRTADSDLSAETQPEPSSVPKRKWGLKVSF